MSTSRNQTLTISDQEIENYRKLLNPEPFQYNSTYLGNMESLISAIPENSVDLLILDPPYNLTKSFGDRKFNKMSDSGYQDQVQSWLSVLLSSKVLKNTASIYFCCDWQTSALVYPLLKDNFHIRNRITWEREKGRGAKSNWKNCHEDIWFCTVSNEFTFNTDAVKLRRKVLAPYKDAEGSAKDWNETADGKYRDTYPSNMWTDITIPFWSMPENTEHPTQKPEKLIAKLILASSNISDVVFDPFAGSGTTSVVAKKLNRKYVGFELDANYACLIEKRLSFSEPGGRIQGFNGSVFFDRSLQVIQDIQ